MSSTLLRGFSWNAHVGRDPQVVRRTVVALIDQYQADVAVIQEAAPYARVLHTITTHRVYGGKGDAEARSTVVLVRRGIPVSRLHLLVTRLPWWGPVHGWKHVGRTFPVVDVGHWPGPRWRIVGVHRVPGGPRGGRDGSGRNAPEWDAEHLVLLHLAQRPSSRRRALVMTGDWNCSATNDHPRGIKALAKQIGATLLPTGTEVDHVMVRGCDGTARRRENYGSDHPLVSFVLRHQDTR